MAERDTRTVRVKNRAPAPIQISAEQLLREANERQEPGAIAPKQRIEDFEELSEYRGRKRKEFEETIRRTRSNVRAWCKYANWEASQGEYARSRSVFERALDVDPQDRSIWLSYTEAELKARNIAHARNLFDRAVTLLPRVDQLWYKYVYLEELLGNIAGARQVFERWMAWEPNEKAWSAYIKLEMRYQEAERASALYERLVSCHPDPKQWVKWAKFEEDRSRLDRAREIYQMALEFFGEEEEQLEKAQGIYASFAKFEVRHKEYDRARVIYKYALQRLPRSKTASLYGAYTTFEKQFGDRSGIESTVLGKRRIQYEEELQHEPRNYDTWFDYSRLEEDAYIASLDSGEAGDPDRVREIYERAIAQMPPSQEKRHWRRYIFLFINYALFEETRTKDLDRAKDVYDAALKLIPHKKFTFAKIWLLYAYFHLRRLDIAAARKVLGASIGLCPKAKLFSGYIELEIRLCEFDRCRKLYQQFLAFDPTLASAWIKFTELERGLGDEERARAIYELAVDQTSLDMPELLWKSYIDFEYDEEQWDLARRLYERLLEKASHVKVWVSFAQFEATVGRAIAAEVQPEEVEEPTEEAREAIDAGLIRARQVFERGYADLKRKELKEERVVLVEAWRTMEETIGDAEGLAKVDAHKHRTVKKRRKVDEDGTMEEYYDIIFADDEAQANPASFKLLQAAHAWAQKKAAAAAAAQAAAAGAA
ncbi:uncharacterized protein L969DRAFT_616538 [Mixia osmundae IAM 14324]|uniref:Suppressor of forked domain-containing protein n=1 Tax=Mixia osmundae (strain CBS 9802 / IAM 14324 / JCM 22182 / KY 12970) TaxID=764103 RepID=G7E690_MIXOS|nr:uncharacterized protein L969DRAFT_616538 [Mixia osmundae IAM 14324]KEI40495.1 hypothetical protein L969DRAFT_616538 [Mixia osmundae IAM 14324]GAA98350.1 hypothetical protein E5Q_05036 [Mixia osmundae IAM 14324]